MYIRQSLQKKILNLSKYLKIWKKSYLIPLKFSLKKIYVTGKLLHSTIGYKSQFQNFNGKPCTVEVIYIFNILFYYIKSL